MRTESARLVGWSMVLVGLCGTGFSFAAHPLATEDTGTQGVGNVEFENGFSWARVGVSRTFAYQPQISYGLLPAVDLILQPSWQSVSPADGSVVRGFGDTNIDAKWRFYGEAPLSFGFRAGATLSTNQQGVGLSRGDTSEHALLVTTFDAAPLTVHANFGVVRNPSGAADRKWLGLVSSALMWATSEKLTLTAETTAQSNANVQKTSWPARSLMGAIYTIRPGLDADVGYQFATCSTPRASTMLVGITYRFAP